MNMSNKQGDSSCDPQLSFKTHIDVKDKITFDMLVPYQYLLTIIHNGGGWLYIFVLLIDGIFPESISILFIKLVGLSDIFRHLDAKSVGTLPLPDLDLGHNPITHYNRI